MSYHFITMQLPKGPDPGICGLHSAAYCLTRLTGRDSHATRMSSLAPRRNLPSPAMHRRRAFPRPSELASLSAYDSVAHRRSLRYSAPTPGRWFTEASDASPAIRSARSLAGGCCCLGPAHLKFSLEQFAKRQSAGLTSLGPGLQGSISFRVSLSQVAPGSMSDRKCS